LNLSAFSQPPDVLILNSYHKGLIWSDEVIQGIEKQFNEEYSGRSNLFIEYLDAKRHLRENIDEAYCQYFEAKYKKTEFDMIIANDDAAVTFLENHKEKLFPGCPVVFTGTNVSRSSYPLDYTGLSEEIEFQANLDLIMKLHPDIDHLYIIADNTITGKAFKMKFTEVIDNGNNNIGYSFLSDYTYEDLIKRVIKIGSDEVIFLGIFTEDANGRYISFSELKKGIHNHAQCPVYSNWDFYLDGGILGGKLISGYEYGKEAANLAIEILNGRDVNTIPVRKMKSQFVFDHKQLKKHHISLRKLPQNATVINGPFEVFKENKKLFITILVIIGLMLFTIIILLRYVQSKKHRIRDQNEYLQKIEKINKDLARAKKKAQESNRLKTSFLANISHEIRTPLNAIIGFCRLIGDQRTLSPETFNKYNQLLKINSELLLNLINDIIDLSKIETNQLNLNYTDFDLNELIDNLKEYADSERDKGNKSKIDIIADKGIKKDSFYVRSDDARLRQVLMNLINNAVKFSFTGKIQIGYRINGEHILFFVKDNGIGLKSEDSKYIFESFRQGEEGTTKKYGGAGLGLTLSKGIVDNLGGRIWYEHNDEGHGSIFYVQIPLIPSTENKVKKSQNFVNQMEGKYNWQGKKILVVEDSNMAYELIVKLLKGTEAEFSQEVDGYKAIERCKKDSTIDLVLMDIQLPFLDGYEATKRIKQIRPKLPIIAQTANAMLDDRKKALDAGCEDYIAKPIDRMELADKINNLFFKVKEQS
jgi:signal transduction histidine kinase/CheY-like chemotaxis protein